jgi:hypothetical protein
MSGYDTPKTNSDQLHGTLDMLVLKTLQNGRLHGYAIALRLEQLSHDVLKVEEGSLYPALYRMEARGWLASEWGVTETAALFSVIDAALLRPLPYPHPEELVDVTIREASNGKSGRYGP